MKFFNQSVSSKEYLGAFNEVEYTDFPFKQIILKKDFNSLKLLKGEEVSLSKTEQIKINVNKTGSILFFFDAEHFEKERFASEVSALKEISSDTVADIIYKVRTVYEIASRFNPLFSLYMPKGELKLFSECYETLIGNIQTFYVHNISYQEVENYKPQRKLFAPKEKKPAPKKEEHKEVENKPAEPKPEKPKKEKKEKTKFQFSNPFKVIAEDKYHFLFAFVASFLIGFTIAVSIFNMYLGKTIYIFFLICCAAGMFLNCLIYRDTLQRHEVKSMYFLMDIAMSIIGIALSIGGYYIFLSLSKDKPEVNPKLILILLIEIAAVVVSASIAFLLRVIKKKRA